MKISWSGIKNCLSKGAGKASEGLENAGKSASSGKPKFFEGQKDFGKNMKKSSIFEGNNGNKYQVEKSETSYTKTYTEGSKAGQTREYTFNRDSKEWTKTKIKVSEKDPNFMKKEGFKPEMKAGESFTVKEKGGNSYEVKKTETGDYIKKYTEGPKKGQTSEYNLNNEGEWTKTTTFDSSVTEASYMDSAKNWVSNHKLATAGMVGGLGIVGYSMGNDDESVQAQEAQVGTAQAQQQTSNQGNIFPRQAPNIVFAPSSQCPIA